MQAENLSWLNHYIPRFLQRSVLKKKLPNKYEETSAESTSFYGNVPLPSLDVPVQQTDLGGAAEKP